MRWHADSIPFFMRRSQWEFLQTMDKNTPYYIARVFLGDNNAVKIMRISVPITPLKWGLRKPWMRVCCLSQPSFMESTLPHRLWRYSKSSNSSSDLDILLFIFILFVGIHLLTWSSLKGNAQTNTDNKSQNYSLPSIISRLLIFISFAIITKNVFLLYRINLYFCIR